MCISRRLLYLLSRRLLFKSSTAFVGIVDPFVERAAGDHRTYKRYKSCANCGLSIGRFFSQQPDGRPPEPFLSAASERRTNQGSERSTSLILTVLGSLSKSRVQQRKTVYVDRHNEPLISLKSTAKATLNENERLQRNESPIYRPNPIIGMTSKINRNLLDEQEVGPNASKCRRDPNTDRPNASSKSRNLRATPVDSNNLYVSGNREINEQRHLGFGSITTGGRSVGA